MLAFSYSSRSGSPLQLLNILSGLVHFVKNVKNRILPFVKPTDCCRIFPLSNMRMFHQKLEGVTVGHQRLQLGWRVLARRPSAALSLLLSSPLPAASRRSCGGAAARSDRSLCGATTTSPTSTASPPYSKSDGFLELPRRQCGSLVCRAQSENRSSVWQQGGTCASSARLTGRGWLVTTPGYRSWLLTGPGYQAGRKIGRAHV